MKAEDKLLVIFIAHLFLMYICFPEYLIFPSFFYCKAHPLWVLLEINGTYQEYIDILVHKGWIDLVHMCPWLCLAFFYFCFDYL